MENYANEKCHRKSLRNVIDNFIAINGDMQAMLEGEGKSEEGISPKRMRILERITDDRLKPVVERIKAYETARYQEMLMEERK